LGLKYCTHCWSVGCEIATPSAIQLGRPGASGGACGLEKVATQSYARRAAQNVRSTCSSVMFCVFLHRICDAVRVWCQKTWQATSHTPLDTSLLGTGLPNRWDCSALSRRQIDASNRW
jgi:hypothetical protein